MSLPRTGSTTLARLLNSHTDVRCLVEPFHPRRYRGKFYDIATTSSVDAALELIWARWNAIKHVCESTGWPFPDCPEFNNQVALSAGRVICLMRRNLLRRIVSNLICRRTQFWIGTRAEFQQRLQSVTFRALDPDLVLKQIKEDQKAMADKLDVFAMHDTPVLPLYYEDVFSMEATPEQRVDLINSVLSFAGFTPITMETFSADWQGHFNPALYQWASPEVYCRIPGIDQVESVAGSDETGWLFR